MKERPIIMSGDNPKLILEGRKTQTRRIVDMGRIKPSVWKHESIGKITQLRDKNDHDWIARIDGYNVTSDPFCCPYGVAGDRLWVRETWRAYLQNCIHNSPNFRAFDPAPSPSSSLIEYRCDKDRSQDFCSWRPSIHMPRWASRITLEITKVRVERLQDISESDAREEGCDLQELGYKFGSAREWYQQLWDSLHGKGAWDKNPWVWVIEFRMV